jgi:hypothetical protein
MEARPPPVVESGRGKADARHCGNRRQHVSTQPSAVERAQAPRCLCRRWIPRGVPRRFTAAAAAQLRRGEAHDQVTHAGTAFLASIGAATLGVVLLAAGAAAEPGVTSGVIYGCKDPKSGLIYVVSENTTCTTFGKNFTKVNWNAVGATGADSMQVLSGRVARGAWGRWGGL